MSTIILRDLESYEVLDRAALTTTLGAGRKSKSRSKSKGSKKSGAVEGAVTGGSYFFGSDGDYKKDVAASILATYSAMGI